MDHVNKVLERGIFIFYIITDLFSRLLKGSSEWQDDYRDADKSLAQPTSLSIVFSVQGTGVSPTGPDPENRVGDQDFRSAGRPVFSGLQVPGETFPSWSG
jgi:hypothetical protein